jgi:hypothetical protein
MPSMQKINLFKITACKDDKSYSAKQYHFLADKRFTIAQFYYFVFVNKKIKSGI